MSDDEEILSDDDLRTWQYVSRTITPMAGREVVIPEPEEIVEISPNNKVSDEDLERLVASRDRVPEQERIYEYIRHGQPEGMDKSLSKRLKDGKFPIEAKLDMHGRTQDEAIEGLRYFVRTSYDMGKRCVLIVTGKGVRNDGVLKNQVPRWLNNPGLREYVLGFSYALPKHGGEGALYVLIKNQK